MIINTLSKHGYCYSIFSC